MFFVDTIDVDLYNAHVVICLVCCCLGVCELFVLVSCCCLIQVPHHQSSRAITLMDLDLTQDLEKMMSG